MVCLNIAQDWPYLSYLSSIFYPLSQSWVHRESLVAQCQIIGWIDMHSGR